MKLRIALPVKTFVPYQEYKPGSSFGQVPHKKRLWKIKKASCPARFLAQEHVPFSQTASVRRTPSAPNHLDQSLRRFPVRTVRSDNLFPDNGNNIRLAEKINPVQRCQAPRTETVIGIRALPRSTLAEATVEFLRSRHLFLTRYELQLPPTTSHDV